MSITDELREWMRAHNILVGGLTELTDIADRIDAEHEAACAEAYGNGVQSVGLPDLAKYVKLPVDADGVTIHIGDVMEGVDKYDSLKNVMGKVITVSFESDGIVEVAVQAWGSDGKSWHRAYLDSDASVYRHHHEPTVEDMLWELLGDIRPDMEDEEAVPIVAAYAKRLRLADGEEEQ